MKKTAFVCDSGTGFSVKEIEEMGCFSVPLTVSYDNITKLENEDINVNQVYDLMKQGKILKTSLPPLGLIEELFTKLKNEGYEMIFAVPICRGLSGTIDAMQMIANQLEIEFDYFDCNVTAMVELYMTTRSKELYDSGMSIEAIKEVLKKISASCNTLIVPYDMQHLRRGGRLSPLAATIANLLKIKPVLEINERTHGRIDVLEKVRTMSRALDRTLDQMKKEIPGLGDNYNVTLTHVACEEVAQKLLIKYQEAFPNAKYSLKKLVSVVGVHTGLNSIAIQYFYEY